ERATLLSHLSNYVEKKSQRAGKEVPTPWEESPTVLGRKSQGLGKKVPPPWEESSIVLGKKSHRMGQKVPQNGIKCLLRKVP
ncbi:MAG: hypothetical protein LBN24_05325, partial [Mediterranea sp.]|nr:hypothetical protein [Mediterranea sp.]